MCIDFSEYSAEDSVSINSENAELSYTTINGVDAFVIERENSVIIAWNSDDKFFVLTANTTKEEALEIANGVKRISFK